MAINIRTGQEVGGSNEWTNTTVQFTSDTQNFGRNSRSQNFTLTTYTDAARTTPLGDGSHPAVKTFTVYQSAATLKMLTVGIKSSAPTWSDFNGLQKVVPTSRSTSAPTATVDSNGKYYVYGLSNLAKIRYTMTTATLVSGSSKFLNVKPTSTNMTNFIAGTESSDGTSAYICPATPSWGEDDVYYFYFQVNAGTAATTVNLMIADSSSDHGYVITTTALGEISITQSVVLPATGGSASVSYSNTIAGKTATVSQDTSTASAVAGLYTSSAAFPISVAAGGNGTVTLTPSSKNYALVESSGYNYLNALTSAPKTGYSLKISATGEADKTCAVTQAQGTIPNTNNNINTNNKRFVINSGNNIEISAGSSTEVSFVCDAFMNGDNDGVRVYVTSPGALAHVTCAVLNDRRKISITADSNATGTLNPIFNGVLLTSGGNSPTIGSTVMSTTVPIVITAKPYISASGTGSYNADSDINSYYNISLAVQISCSDPLNWPSYNEINDQIANGYLGIILGGAHAGTTTGIYCDSSASYWKNTSSASYDPETHKIMFNNLRLTLNAVGQNMEAWLAYRGITPPASYTVNTDTNSKCELISQS